MRRFVFVSIVAGVVALAAACWERHAESNVDRAHVARHGPIYRVEMKGWRFPLVHDPVSLLLDRTYEATFTMDLPRIEGVIHGHEIAVTDSTLRYLGRVVITRGTMKVDLYYDDDGTRRPLSWNDDYTLVQKDTAGI